MRLRVNCSLARRHLGGEGFVLYDLSSSYMEERCCPLAALSHSRDEKKGKWQIEYGLICSPSGEHIFPQLTKPTPLQAEALQLLEIGTHK